MSVSVLNVPSPTVSTKGSDGLLSSSHLPSEAIEPFSISFSAQMQGTKSALEGTALEKITGLLQGQEGQDFSALLGESLPQLQAQEINLDETMTTLKDVLNHLDSLEVDTDQVLNDLSVALAQEPGPISNNTIIEELNIQAAVIPAISENIDPEQQGISDIKYGLENAFNELAQILPDKIAPERSDSNSDSDSLDALEREPLEEQVLPTQIMGQVTSASVVENVHNLAEHAAASIPQFARQEKTSLVDKPYLQEVLPEEISSEDLDAGASLDNLLKREGLLNSTANMSELPTDKIPAKLVELPSTSTTATSEQTAHKFSTADLSTLSKQVESTVVKQELPAMTKPFNHPEWKQEFNERIVWMHNKAIPSAELRLNPQHLGPISIQVNVDQDQQASILFNAQNAGVREAIEAALPKLKEMLSAQQVTLTEANVSQQQQQGQGSARQAMQDVLEERSRNGANNSLAHDQAGLDANEIAEEINQGRAVASKGLLSLYA